ncbi:hypothetical protein Y032_0002g816 [Ancylostoma ceylanicum]|uniref:glucuronosyltransferase n=1 Tax=Ancylostoma ceylanicum TaxID=53326 RepID=A0A016W1L1_9BILA|nr:hypothetical protein Y032_0002g816 [Ancylostoma ceylanicum]
MGSNSIKDRLAMIMSFSRLQKESCEYILQDNNTMTTLQNAHFDVGITEVFAACGFGLFEMVDIPHVIGASAVGMFDSMNEFVHVPTMPSFVPSFLSSFDEKMTFPQRFVNFFLHNIVWLATQHILHSYERLFSRYGFDTNLQQLINTRVNYVLSNSDEFLDIAQPSTGKLVHIGGIALPEATTLPKDFQLVMGRKGSKGVVLISFGSNAPTVQDHMRYVPQLRCAGGKGLEHTGEGGWRQYRDPLEIGDAEWEKNSGKLVGRATSRDRDL